MQLSDWAASAAEHWPYWAVTVFLIVGAVIDGIELRVPNWLTYPMIVAGWIYSGVYAGGEGIMWSLIGTAVGLGLLLPAYAIGGMGAGDVKMLAAVGAWVYGWHTFYAFCVSTIVGAVLAVAMVVLQGQWRKHYNQFLMIWMEILTIRDPEKLSAIAAERKPRMKLLPYGIPIAIGTIGYFAWTGMLL
ncbi:MAG TPA: prepilin peptidase [Planctomycetaceae bacterium]|nr:prepilin peptidase [Planctomycetaceae bacterium]